jgi:hypothetical protein
MAATEEPCPFCGRHISVRAERCRFCGEYLYEEDEEEPPRPRRGQSLQPTDLLIPTNVSAWAIGSCYMGLVGFCLPLVGLLFAIPGFIFGILALRQKRRRGSYGAVTGNIRAIIGLVLSSLAILLWGGLLLGMILSARGK